MSSDELFDEIIKQTEKINSIWQENNYSSKKIRKNVENNFFHNKKVNFIDKFAYFYALNNRINERYNNFLKILFNFFSWKKERKLLAKIKQFLNYPECTNSRLIILQKCENYINGEDCFESNNNSAGGRKLQSKQQENALNKNTKHLETNLLKQEMRVDEQENAFSKAPHETKQENIMDKNIENERNINEADFHYLNQSPLNNETKIENNVPEIKDNSSREKIEITKEELLNSDKKFFKTIGNIKNNNSVEIKYNSNNYIDNIPQKSSVNITKTANIFIDNNKKQFEESIFYEQPQDKILDQNFIEKANNTSNKETVLNNYYNERLQTDVKSNNNSIQDQNKIINDEIAKISEKDMQAIKDYMQAEMDKQMLIAEQNGEVYKMPISIEEAISKPNTEKSEVQVARPQNPVLKNKK